ncbi:hypothetical protein SF23_18400 [Streptomyces sp. MBRL 10]|nr:hypothetical protein SF23_18400 [Streptomyces sp. MBRL 10]
MQRAPVEQRMAVGAQAQHVVDPVDAEVRLADRLYVRGFAVRLTLQGDDQPFAADLAGVVVHLLDRARDLGIAHQAVLRDVPPNLLLDRRLGAGQRIHPLRGHQLSGLDLEEFELADPEASCPTVIQWSATRNSPR